MIVGILGPRGSVRGVRVLAASHRRSIIAVNVLHGICYAFFFATVYIFVDEFFPKDVRASAQGLFNLMILGVGALVANSVCPYLMQRVFTNNGTTDFRSLFLVPLGTAVAAAALLALFFHPPSKTRKEQGAVAAAAAQ